MKIAIGCSTRRVLLKTEIKHFLTSCGIEFDDFGEGTYVDVARRLCEAISRGVYSRGILICGTGLGMAIAANKVPGIYAANCFDVKSAENSRKINKSNVITLGDIAPETAKEIIEVWLGTEFSGDEGYLEEIKKIKFMEDFYAKGR